MQLQRPVSGERSISYSAGGKLKSFVLLCAIISLSSLFVSGAWLHAQYSVSPAPPPAVTAGTGVNVNSLLPDAPSPSLAGSDQAQTEDASKSGAKQNETPPARPQPAVQPAMVDPFSLGHLPGRLHPGPLSVGEKFAYYEKPVFGPRALVTTAVGAGIFMADPTGSADKYPREWRDGVAAFGRNYGDRFARSAASSFGRFSVSAVLHEDPRYSRSTSKSFVGRTEHALV